MSNSPKLHNPKSSLSDEDEILYLGVDAGGTFTDFVLLTEQEVRIHKVLSTPSNPAQAILQGIEELGLNSAVDNKQLCIIHGSTVATNAALERKGARTVYITNNGFGDILSIGRQARKELYNLNAKPPIPPVPSELCLEIETRRDSEGKLIRPLSDDDIEALKQKVNDLKPEAIAINLLFSFINDDEELRIQKALEGDYFVSRSSFVLPKYKEYERGIATWLNASLGPKVKNYIDHLIEQLNGCPVSIMQSSGGTIAAEQAALRSVNLLLSGPAGGLAAVRHIGEQCHLPKIMSFDMGGTSTDVALMDGNFELSDEGSINDWPVAIPMLKMETIGAGGGSIAWIDEGNMLHVGPQSAGSAPGPVCYNKGGTQVTVTDANLVLGRIRADAFLGGGMSLDIASAESALDTLASKLQMSRLQLAEGIIELAEQQMVKALHAISIQKGHNPNDFTLCCFGGAGGLHVCSLAEKLNMKSAIIPQNSGVLSAYGMLKAQKQRQFTKTHIIQLDDISHHQLEQLFEGLESQGTKELKLEQVGRQTIRSERSLDLRYQGQSFTLNIPFSADQTRNIADLFHHSHQQHYGHQLTNTAVELVNVCLSLTIETQQSNDVICTEVQNDATTQVIQLPSIEKEVTILQREAIKEGETIIGPAIILEKVSTTWLKEGWCAKIDQFQHLVLKKHEVIVQ
ncbi:MULTISPECIES: hydantoinase/oxoprolinase family protein [unclassified Oleiphilus]|nr:MULTISPECIES: hydantoinase/oxoprolinase family protein [unclassified Oleiphilus]